jgi:hypothetical protein
VSVSAINAAIDTFSDDGCTGLFPTLTSDEERHSLLYRVCYQRARNGQRSGDNHICNRQ